MPRFFFELTPPVSIAPRGCKASQSPSKSRRTLPDQSSQRRYERREIAVMPIGTTT
jgi:hypothetical protein